MSQTKSKWLTILQLICMNQKSALLNTSTTLILSSLETDPAMTLDQACKKAAIELKNQNVTLVKEA